MGQEELDLSTIWAALGIARDSYAKAEKTALYVNLVPFYREQQDRMQEVRDKTEDRIRMLIELEEYDNGI